MYRMRILNAAQVASLVSMKEAIGCVERAYRLYSGGEAGLWPTIYHDFEPGKRDMDIKSGHLTGAGLFGLKAVAWVADNPVLRGLPALAGLVVVLSSETGLPLGIVDGMALTNLRTGAAGALGARTLARPGSRRALIAGTGAQGRAQLEGLVTVLPELREVAVTSPDDRRNRLYLEEMSPRFPGLSLSVAPWGDLDEALSGSDVVVTCTPSREPFIADGPIRPGTHVNAIGADSKEKRELDENLVARASLFVDSRGQTLDHGEIRHAFERGLIVAEAVTELGAVLAGSAPGRQSDDEITLFDSTGMALQDIITADLALRRAEERGLGVVVDM